MTGTSLHRLIFGIASVLIIAGTVAVYEFELHSEPEDSLMNSEFRCVLDITPSGRGETLLPGYNYLLLKNFADSLGSTTHVLCSYGDRSYIDSLKLGAVDIVVLSCRDTSGLDSVLLSRTVGESTVWAVRSDMEGSLREINVWLETIENDPGHLTLRSLYMHRFNPLKAAVNGRRFKHISPYDDIIREQALRMGWDWRMLAAVIFQESRFHIEAYSRRGARGLMQMMPTTAGRYNVENLIDPEQSIRAGAEFLSRLENLFRTKAADAGELHKFTLAAYNAGEGRILDCINYTEHIGGDSSTWDGIVKAIPGMRDESVLQVDTVRLGIFQGHETIAFVNSIMNIYDAFLTICPE